MDASALLALLHGEPGGDQVGQELEHSAISAVNWSEVLQKSLARGGEIEGLREELELSIVPFTLEDAELAAGLWLRTRPLLSIGDRACLALALRLDLPTLTARSWKDLSVGVKLVR